MREGPSMYLRRFEDVSSVDSSWSERKAMQNLAGGRESRLQAERMPKECEQPPLHQFVPLQIGGAVVAYSL